MATAVSNVSSNNWIIINNGIKIDNNLGPKLPNNVIKIWPAIIFAVSRTVRVIGRMMLLIVSIHTIKGIKIFGVPWGTKWINIFLVLLIQP